MIHPVVVNPVLSPVVRVTDPVRWRAGRNAPLDAILHWDADIDAFAEQTGGVHTFEYAVLSPQYQRNADGSYSNVGARPAVDVFGGEKWLRSCGAVTNLLPSGAEGLNGSMLGVTVSPDGLISMSQGGYMRPPYFSNTGGDHAASCEITEITGGTITLRLYDGTKLYDATTSTPKQISASGLLASSSYTTMYLRNDSGVTITFRFRNPQITATSYPVPYVPPGVTQPASNATTTNGSWFALPDGSPLWHALDGGPETDGVELVMNGGFDSADGWGVGVGWGISSGVATHVGPNYGTLTQLLSLKAGETYAITFNFNYLSGGGLQFGEIGNAAITTLYSGGVYTLKFTSVGSTGILFSGGSVNGSIDNISVQRIQPQPLTLATRVRMGVGSGDIGTGIAVGILSCKNTQYDVLYCSDSGTVVKSYDGTTTPYISGISWPRDSIIRRITQVNTAGTQFRVGYMIEGTHTAIQWGAWRNYDSSFNPSTLYRLMLGYNSAYPMWFSRITAWKEQVSDERILEALNG